ncbi:MAG: hypothetical protein ABI358_00550, partial [Ginsengibacter sp.]
MLGTSRFIVSLCGLILFFFSANAQETKFSGKFYDLKFPQFVQQIEGKSAFHFYYDESTLDTFTVNVTLTDESINDALNKIFGNTTFHFSIDPLNHVFITKNKSIQTALAVDFFTPENLNAPHGESQNEPVIKEKSRPAFVENKLFEIGSKSASKKSKAVITGFVKDIKNGEALPGASLYLDSVFTGIVTDQFGYYSLTVNPG